MKRTPPFRPGAKPEAGCWTGPRATLPVLLSSRVDERRWGRMLGREVTIDRIGQLPAQAGLLLEVEALSSTSRQR